MSEQHQSINRQYDFDVVIDRKNTGSLKYDFARERGMPEDVLPLWVADMDFPAPPAVTHALIRRAAHSIFGYSDVKEEYFLAVRHWFARRFGYEPQAEWLIKTPGVVFALAAAVRAFTDPGDAIIIQRPVYYPFSSVITENRRRLVNAPLVYENGSYHIDFAAFASQIRANRARMFILCSPHNPVGRVWTSAELTRLGVICLENDCLIVSDEIHCDFVFPGFQHHILPTLLPELAPRTILCTAPSKTFNLAGLQTANIFIAAPELREKFVREMYASGYVQLNSMGLIACQSAYEHGEAWLDELLVYLTGNLALLRDFVASELPGVRLIEPEGTYLAWLDCAAIEPDKEKLRHFISHEARLWLDDGDMFGPEGNGFQRVNFACPRATLQKALERLGRAFARRYRN